jgi:hypothetical protein
MDIHYKYNHNGQIISLLLKSFPEFEKDFLIPITFSDELPPIFQREKFKGKENEGKLEDYPIDELMGIYLPETRNIVIYLQGINRAAMDLSSILKISNLYEKLLKIVMLHEIGHYWFHNGEFLSLELAEWFDNPQVNEWIAQMFVFLCIKEDEILKQTMLKLSNSQSEIYQSFWCTQNMSNDHYKEIIEEIKKTKPEDRLLDRLKENEHIKYLLDIYKYNM